MLFKSNPSNSDGKNKKNTQMNSPARRNSNIGSTSQGTMSGMPGSNNANKAPSNRSGMPDATTRTPYLYRTPQSGQRQTSTGESMRSETRMPDAQTGTPDNTGIVPVPQNDTMQNNMTSPQVGRPPTAGMPSQVSPSADRTGMPASPADRTGTTTPSADRTGMPPVSGTPQERGSVTTPPDSMRSMPDSMNRPMNRGTTPSPQTGGQMPGGFTTQPQNGMPTPGGTMTQPRNGMPMPGGTMTRPQNNMMTPGSPMTQPQNGMPTPGGTITRPQNNMMTPGSPMTQPQNGMPMPGGTMAQPRNGMPAPDTTAPVRQGAPQMPQDSMRPIVTCPFYPAGTGNMNIQGSASNNASGVVPLFPLYGYDNGEDVDRDWEYMKQLYPSTAKTILREINNECDKLEYDGSFMFDEYPDKTSIDRIVDRVYEKIRDLEEEPQVEMNSVYYYPRRRSNFLRDIVSLVLLNELFNRRRRYNRRRRWF